MMHSKYDCVKGCPVEATLDIIGGKWKGVVLYNLLNGTKRFNELRRLIPDCSQRILTKQLRELETVGVLSRKVFAEVPPRVEYALTDFGLTLAPVLSALCIWGDGYLRHKGKERHSDADLMQS